jgi:DNA replication initiation complex subunit (GINS family)
VEAVSLRDLPRIRDMSRNEAMRRSLAKIQSDFYLTTLLEIQEREKHLKDLKKNDMEAYVRMRVDIDSFRKDLRAFAEKRAEKILILGLFDVRDPKVKLTEEEEILKKKTTDLVAEFMLSIGAEVK